jgi:uncharacterized protein
MKNHLEGGQKLRLEVRENQVILQGYVNVVGRPSKTLHRTEHGKFIEIIVPGTFKKALMLSKNVDLFFNHLKSRKIGTTKQGNVELYEDNIGLRIECTINDPEVIKQAKNGSLQGWSFEFKAYKQDWIIGADNIKRRFIQDLTLSAISLLGIGEVPAYNGTSVEVRSIPFNSLGIYEKELEILKPKGGEKYGIITNSQRSDR